MKQHLLFLSFDRSFLFSLCFRQTLLFPGFTFFKFLQDRVTDQEVLPPRFMEDIIWLEIDNLSRRWALSKRTKSETCVYLGPES